MITTLGLLGSLGCNGGDPSVGDTALPPTEELCADGATPFVFDPVGPHGIRRGDLAADFMLPTKNGDLTLSDHFGCESFGFVPERDESTAPTWPTLWERDVKKLVKSSPQTVQWLFFTDSDDPKASRDALQVELDTALAEMSEDEAAHWADRLHIVTSTPDNWDDWPREKWETIGYGFLVGRDQRIRDIGALADGTRYDPAESWFEENVSYAVNEVVAIDFAVARETEIASESRRVVPLFDQSVTGAAEVLLDEDFTAVSGLQVDLSLGCTGDREFGSCPPWDYLVYLHECGREVADPAAATDPCQPYVPGVAAVAEVLGTCHDLGVPTGESCTIAGDCAPGTAVTCEGYVAPVEEVVEVPADTLTCSCDEPDDLSGDHLRTCLADGTGFGGCPCRCEEIGRWVTPYHREGRWVHDISPLTYFLADPGPDRLLFSTSQTYEVDLTLRLDESAGSGPPDVFTFLFSGGTFLEDYNDNRETLLLDVPAGATKVELVAVISGHGFGADAANCAEFCNHTHHFFVNGVEHVREHPEAGSDEGCVEQVAIGTTPNQFGTWFFGRGGWCPGLEIAPWVVDVTADVTAGEPVSISYEGRLDGEPYVPDLTGGTFYPRIDMVSWLAIYE